MMVIKQPDIHNIHAEREWWRGRKVAVWGAARSGVSAAKLLASLGAEVTLSDPRDEVSLPLAHCLPQGIKTSFGVPNQLKDAEVLIPSPGLKPSHPLIERARVSGVRIMSEIELGSRVTEAKIIAITGTDGKSTTTRLIEEAISAQGCWSRSVGNIGDPLSNWALEAPSDGYLVVEVSAFQLWSTSYLNAELGVITNIAEDHHDYFDGSASAYRDAKLRLTTLLKPGGALFYPRERLSLDLLIEARDASTSPLELISYDLPKAPIPSLLIGRHNQLNLCVALGITERLGFDLSKARTAFRDFSPLPYRMTLSGVIDGVRYVNDSKASNVHAALSGILSVQEPLLVITGGYDKGLDLEELISALHRKARLVYCIGQTGVSIHNRLLDLNAKSSYVETLEKAVISARENAFEGEMVLLSPAASSFDQFKNFEERGALFDTLVSRL